MVGLDLSLILDSILLQVSCGFLDFYCILGLAMFMRRSFSTLSSSVKMSTYTTDKASPFTRAVVKAMRRLYVLILLFLFFVFGWGKS